MSESTTTETQTTTQNQSEINSQTPPETSVSTNEPTTNYQASDLDSHLISRDNNNNKILRKSGRIPVASKKVKEREKWLKILNGITTISKPIHQLEWTHQNTWDNWKDSFYQL